MGAPYAFNAWVKCLSRLQMKAANTLSERKLDVLDVLDVRLLMFIYNYYKNIYIYIQLLILNISHFIGCVSAFTLMAFFSLL